MFLVQGLFIIINDDLKINTGIDMLYDKYSGTLLIQSPERATKI